AVGEQSVYEDDIPRLRRCLGAGDSIEQGKGGASGDSPDQCPAVHHSLLSNYGLFRSVLGKSVARLSVMMLRVFMAPPLAAPALPPAAHPPPRLGDLQPARPQSVGRRLASRRVAARETLADLGVEIDHLFT